MYYLPLTMLNRKYWHSNRHTQLFDLKIYRLLVHVVKYFCSKFENCTTKTVWIIVSQRKCLRTIRRNRRIDRRTDGQCGYYRASRIFMRRPKNRKYGTFGTFKLQNWFPILIDHMEWFVLNKECYRLVLFLLLRQKLTLLSRYIGLDFIIFIIYFHPIYCTIATSLHTYVDKKMCFYFVFKLKFRETYEIPSSSSVHDILFTNINVYVYSSIINLNYIIKRNWLVYKFIPFSSSSIWYVTFKKLFADIDTEFYFEIYLFK